MSHRLRRAAGLVATVMLALAGCGGDGGTGSMPTPVEGGDTDSSATPSASASPRPSAPTTVPSKPPAKAPLVYVVGGRFDSEPAVQGLKLKYPVFFRALVQRDPRVVAATFPRYFYADTVALIDEAKRSGWTMRPPGSLVVRNVEKRPDGIVRISSCRSQTTQYWNPRAQRWVITAPGGTPDVLDMVRRGSGWTMYRWVYPVPKLISCAGVRYPA